MEIFGKKWGFGSFLGKKKSHNLHSEVSDTRPIPKFLVSADTDTYRYFEVSISADTDTTNTTNTWVSVLVVHYTQRNYGDVVYIYGFSTNPDDP